MSTSQPAGKKPTSPVPGASHLPADTPQVDPAEVQALLNSLGAAADEQAALPPDPRLQSWFQGMLPHLPGEQSADRPATEPIVAPRRTLPAPQHQPAPRRGRMEAWELGQNVVSPQNVSLGSAATSSSPPSSNPSRSKAGKRPADSRPAPSVSQEPSPRELNLQQLGRDNSASVDAEIDELAALLSKSSQTPAAPRRETGLQRVTPSPAKGTDRHDSRQTTESPEPPAQDDESEARDEELRDRVIRELQRVPALSQAAVQVTVRKGTVTLVGELSGDYERQLVGHFARQVRGVNEVVDLTRVRGGETSHTTAASKPTAASRSAPRKAPAANRSGGSSWSLPLRPAWIAGVAGLFVLAWCGLSFGKRDMDRIEVHPAKGQVKFGEVIPEGALLTFHPLSPALTIRPKGTVKADGTFQVSTYGAADGAPEGDYRVTIVWHKLVEIDGEPTAGPNLLPAPYAQPGTTELRVSVKPSTNEFSPLQIRP